jgi:hypothetical protein
MLVLMEAERELSAHGLALVEAEVEALPIAVRKRDDAVLVVLRTILTSALAELASLAGVPPDMGRAPGVLRTLGEPRKSRLRLSSGSSWATGAGAASPSM